MAKHIIIFLVSCLFLNLGMAQYSKKYSHSFYGPRGVDESASPYKIINRFSGNGFSFMGLVKGEFRTIDTYQTHIVIADQEGEPVKQGFNYFPSSWHVSDTDIPRYYPVDMIATEDNGILLLCYSDDFSDPDFTKYTYKDPTLIKLDSLGNEEWQIRYTDNRGAGGGTPYATPAIFKTDGGYLLAMRWGIQKEGGLAPKGYGEEDVWITKITAVGEVLWSKNYGGSASEILRGVVQKPNGDLAFMVQSKSRNKDLAANTDTTHNGWYFEIDKSGVLVKSQTFYHQILKVNNTSGWRRLSGMFLLPDQQLLLYGEYALTGDEEDQTSGHHNSNQFSEDGYFLKYNPATNTFSLLEFFGGSASDGFTSAIILKDGTYAFGGITASKDGDLAEQSYIGADAWFLRTDSVGNIIETLVFDKTDAQERIHTMVEADNGDLFCLASIRRPQGNVYWILKLSKNSTGVYEVISKKPMLCAFPNPNHTGVLHTNLVGNYQLVDMQGRKVKSYTSTQALDIIGLQKGTYVLQHSSGATQQVVVE